MVPSMILFTLILMVILVVYYYRHLKIRRLLRIEPGYVDLGKERKMWSKSDVGWLEGLNVSRRGRKDEGDYFSIDHHRYEV